MYQEMQDAVFCLFCFESPAVIVNATSNGASIEELKSQMEVSMLHTRGKSLSSHQ